MEKDCSVADTIIVLLYMIDVFCICVEKRFSCVSLCMLASSLVKRFGELDLECHIPLAFSFNRFIHQR